MTAENAIVRAELAQAPVKLQRPPVKVGERGIMLTSLDDLWRFAQYVSTSGLAPKGMEKPETILVAIQLGLELGISPISALQNIGVINGRPGIYGDAALALVRASGLCESYEQKWDGLGDKRKAIVTSKRFGAEPQTHEFGVEDARRAGLWDKAGPWKQYPDRMLLFRARGFNLRDNFGDVLKGMRMTEELADTLVTTVHPAPGRYSLRNGSGRAEYSTPPEPTESESRAEMAMRELVESLTDRLEHAETEVQFQSVGAELVEHREALGVYHAGLLSLYQQRYAQRCSSARQPGDDS